MILIHVIVWQPLRSVYESSKLHWLPLPEVAAGPPNRVMDEMRRAEFKESLDVFARIKKFTVHCSQLKVQLGELSSERIFLTVKLGHLHRDVVNLEREMVAVSADHIRTHGTIQTALDIFDVSCTMCDVDMRCVPQV